MPAQWPHTRPDGTPIRVILYARVSTEEQGEAGRQSPDAQIHEMRELANELRWTIVHEYREEESGAERHRPLLTDALNRLQAAEADALMVHDLSRLARSLLFTLEIFERLRQHNALFISKREHHYDFREPNDRLFLTILAMMHEYSLELLRSHTRKSKRERARKGLYNASIIPFGYAYAGKPDQPPTLVPAEAQIVVAAVEYYARGTYSDRQVATWLNAQGYRTKDGKKFTDNLIRDMLQNPFYIGKIAYKRKHGKTSEMFEGQHEAILPLELWERCQAVRRQRQGSPRRRSPVFRPYLLAQVGVCDVCGAPLRSQAQQGDLTYYRHGDDERAKNLSPVLTCPHRRMSIRTDTVDPQMHALIRTLALDSEWNADLVRELRNDEHVRLIQKQRRQLENELSELRHQKQRGEFAQTPQAYFRDLERLNALLAQLPKLEELDVAAAVFASSRAFQAAWENADRYDQRDLLRLMVAEVRVALDTGYITALTPLEAFAPLFRSLPGLVEHTDGSFIVVATPPATLPMPRLPDLTADAPLAVPPFFAQIPLTREENARIAPGLSEALKRCRDTGRVPHTLLQIESPYLTTLPADVRRWRGTTARTLARTQLQHQRAESVEVLATYLYLWETWMNPNTAPATETLIEAIVKRLTRGGVWYALEVLPTDLSAHWLWRFFSEAEEWLSPPRLPDLLALNQQLQDAGLITTVRRRVYAQRVRLDTALAIAEQRQGLLAHLPDTVYAPGLERLRHARAQNGAETWLDSQVALVEWWGQKQ